MNTYFDMNSDRGRFRDHGTFWLAFIALVIVSAIAAAAVFATVGLPAAAGMICVEISLAMYGAIR
jgi:hypothetical protein